MLEGALVTHGLVAVKVGGDVTETGALGGNVVLCCCQGGGVAMLAGPTNCQAWVAAGDNPPSAAC